MLCGALDTEEHLSSLLAHLSFLCEREHCQSESEELRVRMTPLVRIHLRPNLRTFTTVNGKKFVGKLRSIMYDYTHMNMITQGL